MINRRQFCAFLGTGTSALLLTGLSPKEAAAEPDTLVIYDSSIIMPATDSAPLHSSVKVISGDCIDFVRSQILPTLPSYKQVIGYTRPDNTLLIQGTLAEEVFRLRKEWWIDPKRSNLGQGWVMLKHQA
jgi:hypothetical protein